MLYEVITYYRLAVVEIDILNAFTSQNLTDIEVTIVEGLIISNDKNEFV